MVVSKQTLHSKCPKLKVLYLVETKRSVTIYRAVKRTSYDIRKHMKTPEIIIVSQPKFFAVSSFLACQIFFCRSSIRSLIGVGSGLLSSFWTLSKTFSSWIVCSWSSLGFPSSQGSLVTFPKGSAIVDSPEALLESLSPTGTMSLDSALLSWDSEPPSSVSETSISSSSRSSSSKPASSSCSLSPACSYPGFNMKLSWRWSVPM